jgi:integrase
MTRMRKGKKLGQHLNAKNVYTLPGPDGDSPNVDYMDPSLPGFGLRVSRGGQRTWIVRYTVKTTGKRRRMSVGECRSDDSGKSLADARTDARKALRKAEDGIDPQAEQQEYRKAKTFDDLCDDWLNHHGKDKRSLPEDRRIIENELRPAWKDTKLVDLTRADVLKLVRAKAATAPIMANRIGALVSTMLNRAMDDRLVSVNVAMRLPKQTETSRDRTLTDAELVELWNALGERERTDEQGRPVARLNETLADAMMIRFLTATRGSEAARMRWSDIDLAAEVWEIPPAYTKNKQPHRVPLTTPAMQIISRRLATAHATDIWVFQNTPGTNVRARLKKAASFLCRGDAHLSRRRKGAKGVPIRQQRPAYQPGLTFAFRGHDLRRTGSTWLGDAGVLDETISRVLNHVNAGPRSTRVYNRAKYDAPKRAALEVIARRLDALVRGGQQATNVLAFAGTR